MKATFEVSKRFRFQLQEKLVNSIWDLPTDVCLIVSSYKYNRILKTLENWSKRKGLWTGRRDYRLIGPKVQRLVIFVPSTHPHSTELSLSALVGHRLPSVPLSASSHSLILILSWLCYIRPLPTAFISHQTATDSCDWSIHSTITRSLLPSSVCPSNHSPLLVYPLRGDETMGCVSKVIGRDSWGNDSGSRGVSMIYIYILWRAGIWDENTFQSVDFSEIERFVYIK